MKILNESYNLFPVYETVEVMHIVVKSGILSISRDKQDRVVIKGPLEAIKLINIIYNKDPNSTPVDGHIGFFDEREYIFPKGYTFHVEEADNNGTMIAFHVYKKEFIGFNGQMVGEDNSLPWHSTYIVEELDGSKQVSTPIELPF